MDGRTFVSALALALGLWIGIGFGLGFVLAGLAIGLFALLVLLTALASRQALHVDSEPEVTAVEIEDPDLPEEVTESWRSLEAELESEGLLRATARRSTPTRRTPEEYSACWTAPCGTFFVVSSIVYPPGKTTPQRITSIATWTQAGQDLETSNRDDLLPVSRLDGVEFACFPGVRNEELLGLHRMRLARLSPPPRGEDVLLPGDDAVEFSREAHARFCAAMCRTGYLYPVPSTGYRPTLRGWVRWTTAHLWPILPLRRCLARRHGYALLHEIARVTKAPEPTAFWTATLAGATAVTGAMSLPLGLGVTSWAFLGIAGALMVQERRGRPFGATEVLIGGVAGITPIAILRGVPDLLFMLGGAPTYALFADPLSWLLPAGLYILGAATLFWGWSGVPYLHSAPIGTAAIE